MGKKRSPEAKLRRSRRKVAKRKAKREADPAYQAYKAEKEARRRERIERAAHAKENRIVREHAIANARCEREQRIARREQRHLEIIAEQQAREARRIEVERQRIRFIKVSPTVTVDLESLIG